jgi:hypothetical protein
VLDVAAARPMDSRYRRSGLRFPLHQRRAIDCPGLRVTRCAECDGSDKFLAELDEPLPSIATTGFPGGGIAFNSGDYATEEEAEAAHEAFLMKAFGVSDEDD